MEITDQQKELEEKKRKEIMHKRLTILFIVLDIALVGYIIYQIIRLFIG